MLHRHRLTALVVSLILLPSAATGGRLGCVMPTGGSGNAATSAVGDEHPKHTGAARHEHGGPSVDAAVVSHHADTEPSHSLPHAPAECLSAPACVGVALGAPSDLIASAHPRDAGVAADTTLAPLSPAFALEPPPPRA